MIRKIALENFFRKKEKTHPPTSGVINQVVKAQKDSATNIRKLVHKVQDHQQKAAVGIHNLLSEVSNLKNIEKKRQKLTNAYIEGQKCDTSLPPLKAQLVLEEASLPSYSQVATEEEMTERQKNSPTAPLYPDLTETIEKAMPVSDISESDEPITMKPLHKPQIDPRYERLARHWGFDRKQTREENLDIIKQNVTDFEKRLREERYPKREEQADLQGGKDLLKVLPTIITSLMPTKFGKGPLQRQLSFEDTPTTSGFSRYRNNPITSTPDFDLEKLWQKAIKRFGFSNEKLAKRIWEINQSLLDYYLKEHDGFMIHAYRNKLELLKMIGNNLLHTETNLFEEKSPKSQEGNKSKVKILPFENENEFYQCTEPWGIKRNGSLQEKEATLIVAERNARERLNGIFIRTPCEYENLEKFHHHLVEIDKLKWYIEEGSLQPSEISRNTSQKKTIPKTLVTPLLEVTKSNGQRSLRIP